MAALVKYNAFVTELRQGTHDGWMDGPGGDADVLKVTLSDTVPDATDTNLASGVEIANLGAASDWSAGGKDIVNTSSQTTATITVVATDVTCTASGALDQFSYVLLINSTTDNLIGYYSIGSAINLIAGQTFTVNFGANLMTMA